MVKLITMETQENYNFYFNNPISLILLCSTSEIHGKILFKTYFVNPDPNKRNYNHKLNSLTADLNFQISQKICEILKVTIQRVDWESFAGVSEPFAESLLIKKTKFKPSIVQLYAADSYCIFGFKQFYKFTITKLRLFFHWRVKLKINRNTKLFIINESKISINHKNIVKIDRLKSENLVKSISKLLIPDLLVTCGLDLNQKYLLVLPYPNYPDPKFLKNFFSKVNEIAESENLKILLKPHRKDKTDFSPLINSNFAHISNPEYFKLIPVEFLYSLECVHRIAATPSTSLFFASVSRTEVFATSNYDLYRKYFLDCETYLRFIGMKYNKI
jgi:hypothetical protein